MKFGLVSYIVTPVEESCEGNGVIFEMETNLERSCGCWRHEAIVGFQYQIHIYIIYLYTYIYICLHIIIIITYILGRAFGL